MNTPAHLIFGLSAFGDANFPRRNLAAVIGALAPDLSLFIMVAWCILVQNIPPQVVFDTYYYSDSWQFVFAIDNSFILWGALFGLACWRRWPVMIAFAGAGLLHLAFDFPLHNKDARQHFWPISDWVFHSPLSYWNSQHFGRIIGLAELLVCAGLIILLLGRFRRLPARTAIAGLALLEIMSSGLFYWLF